MNTENILVQDTSGDLANDILKNDPDKESLSVWFSDLRDTDKKIVNFSVNNIRYDSVPNITTGTYLSILTYNGSSGYQNKMFSSVVAEETGIFNKNNIPVLTFDPSNASSGVDIKDVDFLENVVVDIKMYNGTIDVLNYADSRMGYGPLRKGSNQYIVQSRRSFPTQVDTLPNVCNKKIYLDGWYSFTHIIYKDLAEGSAIVDGNFYARQGEIFKSNAYGVYFIDAEGYGYVTDNEGNVIHNALTKVSKVNYEEILFSLNETSDLSPQSNSVYLHSQVLITEELRVAILQEIIDVSCAGKSGCAFMDWQKLNLKQLAAGIMFQNGMYEKAQIILESAREMCNGMDFNLNC